MSNKPKGVHAEREQRRTNIIADRTRGLTWGQIGLRYGMERTDARRMATRVRKIRIHVRVVGLQRATFSFEVANVNALPT